MATPNRSAYGQSKGRRHPQRRQTGARHVVCLHGFLAVRGWTQRRQLLRVLLGVVWALLLRSPKRSVAAQQPSGELFGQGHPENGRSAARGWPASACVAPFVTLTFTLQRVGGSGTTPGETLGETRGETSLSSLTPGEQVLAFKQWVAAWLPFAAELNAANITLITMKSLQSLV